MQHPFIALRNSLSPERISTYQRPGETEAWLFARYLWDMTLSEALYPSLHSLEIGLRNTLHNTLTQDVNNSLWFDLPNILLPDEANRVYEAKQELTNVGKPLDPGRIVAELSFGFWTSLLNARYEQRLWPRLLQSAFPAMPRTLRNRKNISRRLNEIRKLRNRVFHYESVSRIPSLTRKHADILEAISWINPELRSMVELIDRFPEVHRSGLAEAVTRVETFVRSRGFMP